ncbi:Hemolysin, contains CBS domains [Tessaracoccus bendigoensis DSM 12906]|uniref:Hemolysin, contains CBS domains n=1 Tax=Tessaracoccus bendigoensis DSM 12906 TaxID=1123357 RepID=A0A1M6E4U4_9ACTN|nr:hemolysin family protein [Tessaracoccus bendigoensis]SHI80517.1 Hemolysin, contains CBS domains [Tessaracoccus bendigoensis DSM 12906]
MIPLAMNGWSVTLWTVGLIALSAFFVASEFALMAAKQHRLELRAGTAAGRAALKNSSEITIVLAGAQLGITICTLALGAITKPAVHHALMPLLELGLPTAAADVVAFVLALIIVTFLHLVIGEMAPKSWAIAHPEDSSVLLALPLRGYMWLTRPILHMMNAAANWLVRRAGAEPVSELGHGQDAAGLKQLVEHSAKVGSLDSRYSGSLRQVLTLRDTSVGDVLTPGQLFSEVPVDATIADVQEVARYTRHLRILVRDGGHTVGVVHVRDTLAADPSTPALGLARPPVLLTVETGLSVAVATVRKARTQLAVVTDGENEIGIITFEDVLPSLMPSAILTPAG